MIGRPDSTEQSKEDQRREISHWCGHSNVITQIERMNDVEEGPLYASRSKVSCGKHWRASEARDLFPECQLATPEALPVVPKNHSAFLKDLFAVSEGLICPFSKIRGVLKMLGYGFLDVLSEP